jgi:hypothetical protein
MIAWVFLDIAKTRHFGECIGKTIFSSSRPFKISQRKETYVIGVLQVIVLIDIRVRIGG